MAKRYAPKLICPASKIESVAATANVLALDVQSHFTQYLQRGSILVIHELITALSVEICWRGETGVRLKTSLLHINDFNPYDLMTYQKFLHTALNGDPHLLRPALDRRHNLKGFLVHCSPQSRSVEF